MVAINLNEYEPVNHDYSLRGIFYQPLNFSNTNIKVIQIDMENTINMIFHNNIMIVNKIL